MARVVAATAFETPIGTIGVEASAAGLRRVRLPGGAGTVAAAGADAQAAAQLEAAAEQLAEYACGQRESFELELDWAGVDDTHRRVLEALCEIAPFGTTVTYGELGLRAGVEDPREVGVLMARNPLPLVVPCHRVVASDGLGGFGGGLELKHRLLELEGVLPARLDLGDLYDADGWNSGTSGSQPARSTSTSDGGVSTTASAPAGRGRDSA